MTDRDLSGGSALLKWSTPIDTGGSLIQGYTIYSNLISFKNSKKITFIVQVPPKITCLTKDSTSTICATKTDTSSWIQIGQSTTASAMFSHLEANYEDGEDPILIRSRTLSHGTQRLPTFQFQKKQTLLSIFNSNPRKTFLQLHDAGTMMMWIKFNTLEKDITLMAMDDNQDDINTNPVSMKIGTTAITNSVTVEDVTNIVTQIVYQEDVDGDTWTASITGVQKNMYYKVEYEVMQGDLGSSNEKVVDVTVNGVSVGGCNPTADDYDCTFTSCNGINENDLKDVIILSTSNSIAVIATYQEHSKDCDCDRSNMDGLCSKEDTVGGRTPTKAALKFKLTPVEIFDESIGLIFLVSTTPQGTGDAAKPVWEAIIAGDELHPGLWYHVAGTYTAKMNLNLYIDGQSVGQKTTVQDHAIYDTTTVAGAGGAGGNNKIQAVKMGYGLNGEISDPRVYADTLNDDQVQQIWTSSSSDGINVVATPISTASPSARIIGLVSDAFYTFDVQPFTYVKPMSRHLEIMNSDSLTLEWAPDGSQWSELTSFDLWIRPHAVGNIIHFGTTNNEVYSLELLDSGRLEAKFESDTFKCAVTVTTEGCVNQLINDRLGGGGGGGGTTSRDPNNEWKFACGGLLINADRSDTTMTQYLTKSWTHVAIGLSTNVTSMKRRLNIWMNGHLAGSEESSFVPTTMCYIAPGHSMNETYQASFDCGQYDVNEMSCKDMWVDRNGNNLNELGERCTYNPNVAQKSIMTQTIIGGGTFEGELDNIRIMDIATSATPTAEDAMSTALVRKLMLTTLKPMTGVGSIKNIKALFTFDEPDPKMKGIIDSVSATSPGSKSKINENGIFFQKGFWRCNGRDIDTGSCTNSFVNKDSFRGTPLPTMPSAVFKTAPKGKPATPTGFTIDQNDMASWYNTPVDFGGEHPADAGNKVTICKAKSGVQAPVDCDTDIWTGTSKSVLTPTTVISWPSNNVIQYSAQLANLFANENDIVVVAKQGTSAKTVITANLEPRREYHVECTALSIQGSNEASLNGANGYKFGLQKDGEDTMFTSIESSTILQVSDSSDSIRIGNAGVMSKSKNIDATADARPYPTPIIKEWATNSMRVNQRKVSFSFSTHDPRYSKYDNSAVRLVLLAGTGATMSAYKDCSIRASPPSGYFLMAPVTNGTNPLSPQADPYHLFLKVTNKYGIEISKSIQYTAGGPKLPRKVIDLKFLNIFPTDCPESGIIPGTSNQPCSFGKRGSAPNAEYVKLSIQWKMPKDSGLIGQYELDTTPYGVWSEEGATRTNITSCKPWDSICSISFNLQIKNSNNDHTPTAPYPNKLKLKVRALNKVGWGAWTYPSYLFSNIENWEGECS